MQYKVLRLPGYGVYLLLPYYFIVIHNNNNLTTFKSMLLVINVEIVDVVNILNVGLVDKLYFIFALET